MEWKHFFVSIVLVTMLLKLSKCLCIIPEVMVGRVNFERDLKSSTIKQFMMSLKKFMLTKNIEVVSVLQCIVKSCCRLSL